MSYILYYGLTHYNPLINLGNTILIGVRSICIIPIELSEPCLKIVTMKEESNKLAQRAKLDLIEEDRKRLELRRRPLNN